MSWHISNLTPPFPIILFLYRRNDEECEVRACFKESLLGGANIRRGHDCSKGYTVFKNPQKTMHFFPADIDDVAEIHHLQLNVMKQCRNGSTSHSAAVDKNLILL